MNRNVYIDDNDPCHVYYDMNIINNDQVGDKPPPNLVFNDIRSNPILADPSQYFCSVVRFTIQTGNSLPLWIPQIQLGNHLDDPDLTVYSFTLTYDDIQTVDHFESGQQYVTFTTEDLSVDRPPTTNMNDVNTSPYYYVKSFKHMIDMFNTALKDAFQRLRNSAGFQGITLPTNHAPFMEWDITASKLILNGDVLGYNSASSGIKIFVNTPLYTLMSGFPSKYYGYKNIIDGRNYQLLLEGTDSVYHLPTYNAIQLYQEYSSASLLSPIASLVFATSLIPVVPSNTGKPQVYNGDNNLTVSNNNCNIASMVTDFHVDNADGYGYVSSIQYVPSSEYRLIDLASGGSSPLSNIELSVFWKDAFNNLHPFQLLAGLSCDLKLLFRKKKFNNF
jgi:hypothetical protein